MNVGDSEWAYVLADLSEEHRKHVLALETNGEVHQSEAGVKRRRTVQQANLVGGQLTCDVTTWWLIGFDCSQIALHHSCEGGEKYILRTHTYYIQPPLKRYYNGQASYLFDKQNTLGFNKLWIYRSPFSDVYITAWNDTPMVADHAIITWAKIYERRASK